MHATVGIEAGTMAVYTNAPEACDGFGAKTLAVVGRDRDGRPVRLAQIVLRHLDWQCERYRSGLFAHMNGVMDLEAWVRCGEWTLD